MAPQHESILIFTTSPMLSSCWWWLALCIKNQKKKPVYLSRCYVSSDELALKGTDGLYKTQNLDDDDEWWWCCWEDLGIWATSPEQGYWCLCMCNPIRFCGWIVSIGYFTAVHAQGLSLYNKLYSTKRWSLLPCFSSKRYKFMWWSWCLPVMHQMCRPSSICVFISMVAVESKISE